MNIIIRTIVESDYLTVYAFQRDYLDQEDFNDFISRVNANPDLYLVAYDWDTLVGICYGHPFKKAEDTINLQGIAVNLEEAPGYARKGIGSKLLHHFEKVAKSKGYQKIGVGSAEDPKVERFYLKNGYQPIELVVKNEEYLELDRLQVKDYELGNRVRQQLRKKYNPREVIFIFQKLL